MKRISYAVMSTLTALVLLFGYRTSTSPTAAGTGTVAITSSAPGSTPTSSASGSGQAANTSGSPPSGSSSSSSPTGTTSSASPAAVTITGTAADTRYGPVQVQLTVQSKKITNVSVVQYPNSEGRDQEINANALPILIDEALKAQSAKIDMVSGATYTSQGYLTSLQSALDRAGL